MKFPEELNSSGPGDKRVETVLMSHELDMLCGVHVMYHCCK